MASTTKLAHETEVDLQRLGAAVADLQDMLDTWDERPSWERQGWDLEWRASLATLRALTERKRAGALNTRQADAYHALLNELAPLLPEMRRRGIPIP